MEVIHRPVFVVVLDQGMRTLMLWTTILFLFSTIVSAQLALPPLRDDEMRDDPGRRLPSNELDIRELLARLDFTGVQFCSANVAAQWAYETNVNDYTQLQALEAQQQYANFQNEAWQLISRVDINSIRDPIIRRRLRYLSVVGPAALPPDQLDRYNRVINDMLAIYNGATICAYNDPFRCGLRLYPDIANIMARSRNWDELQHVWTEWRRRSGRPIRDLYQQLVSLNNDIARFNNFSNAADYWMFPYESGNFEQDVEDVWDQIRPLYEELHAYVRRKLRDLYGPEKIGSHAALPSHILGNIWGQSWKNIVDDTLPYPGKSYEIDATEQMLKQGYTPVYMFRIAEEFFLYLNLSAMPPEFWGGSIIADPGDRPLICQASAWDFCNRLDYRIKMCTKINSKDLVTVHHEMAHIQYFLRYSGLPREFRDGANPGFHEAVGEAVALSVGSPRHLQDLQLTNKFTDDREADMNYLYNLAMEKLVMLPFSIAMDRWRWDIARGLNKEEYNCQWHRLKEEYTGTKPPVLRSEDDFDPGAKYHIPANIPYIRNFVAGVLQFQLYRALCQAAGQRAVDDPRKPLHRCDFARNLEAGKILGKLMEKGSSRPWQETLGEAIGESRMDGTALREFFRPLEDWLRAENLRTNEIVGWSYDGDYCKRSIETAGLQVYGSGFYGGAVSLRSSAIFAGIAAISMTSLLS